jgi:hypothetical protein
MMQQRQDDNDADAGADNAMLRAAPCMFAQALSRQYWAHLNVSMNAMHLGCWAVRQACSYAMAYAAIRAR